MRIKIEHNQSENNFVCQLTEVHAVLSYSRKHEALELNELFVPEHVDKDKIAGELIKAACRYCQTNDLKLIPVAPYVAEEFLPAHPEYENLVQADRGPGHGAEFLRL